MGDKKILNHLILLFFLLFAIFNLCAQGKYLDELKAKVSDLDAAFWNSYNTCDIDDMQKYFSSDLEFYHDKEGLTVGKVSMLNKVKEGLCSDKNKQLRREALPETINIYSIDSYGAIIEGEYLFYFKEGEKDEVLVEKAKFIHIWQRGESDWFITRVLSYDHQTISDNYFIPTFQLDQATLNLYQGLYNAPNSGLVELKVVKNGLELMTQNMSLTLKPESPLVFFNENAPLKFEFIKDEAGNVIKFIVFENGEVVEEAVRQK